MGIMRPYSQPDGGFIEIDSDLMKALNQGYAPLGWEGDPRLYLAWNRDTQRMELWRNCEDGEHRLIVRGKQGQRAADMNLVHFLVTHDPRRGHDPYEAVKNHNEAARKKLLDAQRDKMGEAAERLYHGFQKDIGATTTGLTRDYLPLPEAPWKKNKDA